MHNQFQVKIDSLGNIYCSPGCVIDLGASTTSYFQLSSDIVSREFRDDGFISTEEYGLRCMGGSGQSMEITGSLTGTFAPIGYFRRVSKYEWLSDYGHKIAFDPSTGNADMYDLTPDNPLIIATFSHAGATIAPVGSFSSTVDGQDVYNSGGSFTLSSSYEGRTEDVNSYVTVEQNLNESYATIISGLYSFASSNWQSDTNASWTISIDQSGDAEIFDGTHVVATRIAGDALNPSGDYASTDYGSQTYNNGVNFITYVGIGLVSPIAGYVYAKLTLSSGRVTSVDGIFFESSMPANSSTEQYVPIAYSDGAGKVVQIQQGPIFWK
jgi:hypothetical protein